MFRFLGMKTIESCEKSNNSSRKEIHGAVATCTDATSPHTVANSKKPPSPCCIYSSWEED